MSEKKKYDELEAMARRTDDDLSNPYKQTYAVRPVGTPGADMRQVKRKSIADSIFGDSEAVNQARTARDSAFQAMLDSRKQTVEKQRTDDVKMARYNALGNVLTSMVQPLGWAAGGSAAGVQPYDNRQYIDAFNRAVKASDDLRNIGNAESEYRFNLANEDYKRVIAREDEARRRAYAIEDEERRNAQKEREKEQEFERKRQINQENIAGRIAVAEETAKAKYRYRINGRAASPAVTDNITKKAAEAYKSILVNYYNDVNAGLTPPQPPSYDEILRQFASREGVTLTDSTSSASTRTTSTSTKTPAADEDFSQYKR